MDEFFLGVICGVRKAFWIGLAIGSAVISFGPDLPWQGRVFAVSLSVFASSTILNGFRPFWTLK